jgi:AraC-like DNA-binding protein
LELVLVLKGQYQIAIEDQVLPGGAGTLFVLPPHIPHCVRAPGAWASRFIIFEQPQRILDETARTFDVRKEPELARWFTDLFELRCRDPRPNDPIASGLLLAIVSRLVRLEEDIRTTVALPPQLDRAVRYLRAHFNESVAAEELAREAFVSHAHLCRLFRRQLDCTPRAYQLRLRLEHSRELLDHPYLSIKEVAAQSGFEDVNYFVRLFKRYYKIPPGAWRKKPTQALPVRTR